MHARTHQHTVNHNHTIFWHCLAPTPKNTTHKHAHTLTNGSVVLDPTVSVLAKVTVNFPSLPTPLQCLSPVSTALPLATFKDIVPMICSNTVSEPHDYSALVHWCGCMWTGQHKRQQERAYILQVTVLEFGSVRKLRSVRERHCKMCLTSTLHALAFPKMLRIPALDNTTSLCAQIHPLCSSLRVCCVSWTEVGNVRERFGIPGLNFFAWEISFWGQKQLCFDQKSHTLRFSIV